MIDDCDELHDKVVAIWNDSGLTDAEIASASGVQLLTITRYRKDAGKNPSWFLIARTVEVCGASLDTLVDNPNAAPVVAPIADSHHVSYVEARFRECRRERLMWQKRFFVLVIVVALIALFIATVVIYDLLHPSAGWIQYAKQVTSSAFEQTAAFLMFNIGTTASAVGAV